MQGMNERRLRKGSRGCLTREEPECTFAPLPHLSRVLSRVPREEGLVRKEGGRREHLGGEGRVGEMSIQKERTML